MKIFAKLMGAFSLVGLIAAVVGGIGWMGINRTQHSLLLQSEEIVPSVQALGLIMEGMNGIQAAQRTMIISSLDWEQRQQALKDEKTSWAGFEEGYKQFAALPKEGEEKALFAKIPAALEKWKAAGDKLVVQATHVRLDDVESLEAVLVSHQLADVVWVDALHAALGTRGVTLPAPPDLAWLDELKSHDQVFNRLLAQVGGAQEKLQGVRKQLNTLLGHRQTAAARALFTSAMLPAQAEVDARFAKTLKYVREDIGHLDAARELAFGPVAKTYQNLMALFDHLGEVNHRASEATTASALASAADSKLFAALAVIFGALIALAFGFSMARGIARPMGRTVRMLEEMAKGHLDSRLHLTRQDEIGQMGRTMDNFADNLVGEVVEPLQRLAAGDLTFSVTPHDERDQLRGALKKLGEDLNGILGQVQVAGEQIASGSSQVADASQSLSQGATEQASSLEEITSSMTEMGSQIKQNAENAALASQLSGQAKQAAESGSGQMAQMVAAMSDIEEAGQSISRIIKVIDEIAFQTNLLALNAAVEAARAGAHGKGFTVVAEEVRNLAARSAKAAKETAELIEGSVRKTENGAGIAEKTAEALAGIVGGVAKVTGLVGEIAAASTEQAQGIAQINQGLGQIDQVTQQNTANAEESAAAAEELSGQATQLRQMLRRFQLRGQGLNPEGAKGRDASSAALPAPADGGWGKGTIAQGEGKVAVDPVRVIPLDDEEFGRY